MTNRTPRCITRFGDNVLGIIDYAYPGLVHVAVGDPHIGPTAVWMGTEEIRLVTA